MPANELRSDEWEMTVEDGTMTAYFGADSELTGETAREVQAEFERYVGRPDVTTALTVLRTENPLAGSGLEYVEEASELARDNGIERWAIVVDRKVKGMAFDSKLDGLETAVFTDEEAARAFLDGE